MLALKQYELSNHLGNVLATVLDRKTMTSDKVLAYATNFTGTLDGWTAGWSAAGTIYGATPPTTIALDNNRVKCTSTVSMGGVRKVINTTIGTAYTITMDIDMGTSEGLYIMPRATNGANEFTGTNITQVYVGASGTYNVTFTATTSTTQLLVEKAGYVEKYFFIDNVKVEQSTPTLNSYFVADVVNAQYYYPFGSTMKTWRADGDDYRFGFNGKEDDNETQTQDYGMRIYNPRLGKFLSVDPLTKDYAMLTPYQFASNSPIDGIDLDGLEHYYAADGRLVGKIGTSTEVRRVESKDINAVAFWIKAANKPPKAADPGFTGRATAYANSLSRPDPKRTKPWHELAGDDNQGNDREAPGGPDAAGASFGADFSFRGFTTGVSYGLLETEKGVQSYKTTKVGASGTWDASVSVGPSIELYSWKTPKYKNAATSSLVTGAGESYSVGLGLMFTLNSSLDATTGAATLNTISISLGAGVSYTKTNTELIKK